MRCSDCRAENSVDGGLCQSCGAVLRVPAGGSIATPATGLRETKWFLLGALTAGHAVLHWYMPQSFFVLLPFMKADLGMTSFQIGLVSGVRQLGGIFNIPFGAFSDIYPRHRAPLLSMGALAVGVGFLLMGLSPTVTLLAVAVAFTGIANQVWHPPAIAILSESYPERRGFALTTHIAGGNVGGAVGPIVVGAALMYVTWRQFMALDMVPGVVVALVVLWALAGLRGRARPSIRLGTYLRGARALAGNFALLSLVGVWGLRAMGSFGFLTFFVLYLREDLGYSGLIVGFHVSLLTVVGIVTGPIWGHVSDRVGRKLILVLGLTFAALTTVGIAAAGGGLLLVLLLALYGIVNQSLQGIVLAAAMDVSTPGMEGTTSGLVFTSTFATSALGIVIAGSLVEAVGNNLAALYLAAALSGLAALLMLPIPMGSKAPAGQ